MKKLESKGQKSRERIIQVALDLFAEKGFFETSIQNIAQACDFSQSAVFHHFKDKNILFEAVINYVLQSNHSLVSTAILPQDDAKTRLYKHCRENLKWALKHPHQAKMVILLYYMSTYDSPFRELNTKLIHIGKERVREYLYAGQREGLLSGKMSIDQSSSIFHQWLVGYLLQIVTQKMDSQKRILAEFDERFEHFCHNYLIIK